MNTPADYFRIADQLTDRERGYWRRTRDFVDDEVLPAINRYRERAEFPWPNRILLDYHVMRHFTDIEAIHTYEGTETIQTLIGGRDITGVGAFA
jgi:hypothetical protein